MQPMQVRNAGLLAIAVLLTVVICSPCAQSQGEGELRTRIMDYWRLHSCESKCRNPVIEVRSDTVKVVRFDRGRPIEKLVSLQGLRAFLMAMPLSAWPQGPRLWLRESDVTIIKRGEDENAARVAKHQKLISVIQICNELGLARTEKDGSPLKREKLSPRPNRTLLNPVCGAGA